MTSDKVALLFVILGTFLWLGGALWAYFRARRELKTIRFRTSEVFRRRDAAKEAGERDEFLDLRDVVSTNAEALVQKGQIREAVLSESLKAIGTWPGIMIIAGVLLQATASAIPLIKSIQNQG